MATLRGALVVAFAALLGAPVASGQSCSNTCYGATCDYWDGGYWGTCSSLQSVYKCDCGGCECDGCPQGSCDSPRFDVRACPRAGNAACDASQNTAECAWDGGDCCASTCVGVNCGRSGFDCRDPSAPEMAGRSQEQVPARQEGAERQRQEAAERVTATQEAPTAAAAAARTTEAPLVEFEITLSLRVTSSYGVDRADMFESLRGPLASALESRRARLLGLVQARLRRLQEAGGVATVRARCAAVSGASAVDEVTLKADLDTSLLQAEAPFAVESLSVAPCEGGSCAVRPQPTSEPQDTGDFDLWVVLVMAIPVSAAIVGLCIIGRVVLFAKEKKKVGGALPAAFQGTRSPADDDVSTAPGDDASSKAADECSSQASSAKPEKIGA